MGPRAFLGRDRGCDLRTTPCTPPEQSLKTSNNLKRRPMRTDPKNESGRYRRTTRTESTAKKKRLVPDSVLLPVSQISNVLQTTCASTNRTTINALLLLLEVIQRKSTEKSSSDRYQRKIKAGRRTTAREGDVTKRLHGRITDDIH